MTKEEIIELAREAEMGFDLTSRNFFAELERFANLVAAKERERCALAANKAWFEDPCYISTITDAIRALPTGNLKLENLT